MATRQRKKQRQAKTITKGGKTYTGTLYNGKVTVRMQRTAHGQSTVAGVLTVETGEWQNDKLMPKAIKREFEKSFPTTTISE